MIEMTDLTILLESLIKVAYPELGGNHIAIGWGRISSFATISWNQNLEDIKIKCSNETKKWHEVALIGLLAHELSHPVQKEKSQSEERTDLDVIKRGLGPYLGVERLFAGKYEDHVIRKGRDRYLGYRSIRNQLSSTELKHLDVLLKQLRLVPHRMTVRSNVHHDIMIVNSSTNTSIEVDGYKFDLPYVRDPIVTIIEKGSSTHVLVNGDDIGTIEKEIT